MFYSKFGTSLVPIPRAITAQKMIFSIKEFFRKCDEIRRETADVVIFTEKILNAKNHFLCSV